jgi:hypothetical protein
MSLVGRTARKRYRMFSSTRVNVITPDIDRAAPFYAI